MQRISPLMLVLLGACLDSPSLMTRDQFNDLKDHTTSATDASVTTEDVTGPEDVTDADIEDGDDSETPTDATTDATTVTGPTDTVTETVEDTDIGPGCTEEQQLLPNNCLSEVVGLRLFEPAHSNTSMGPPTSLIRAQKENGASSWPRAGEPVSIPLVNGLLADPDLRGAFAFENNTSNSVSGGIALNEGPRGGPNFAAGQPGLGQSLMANPRFAGAITSINGQSFTLMGWFYIVPSVAASASYNFLGFQTGSGLGGDLTLGVKAGRWVSMLGGSERDFGAVAGGWQHIALTWDAVNLRAVFYLDGRVASALALPSLAVTSDRVFIGVGGMGPVDAPQADDVVFATRTFALDEVRAHASSQRSFGSAMLADVQRDYRDLRVAHAGQLVPYDLVGRRPHGSSGSEVASVWGVWPLDDGSAEPAFIDPTMGTTDLVAPTAAVVGAFGDAGGGFDLTGTNHSDIGFNRTARFGATLGIELWANVAASEAAVPCTTAIDGTTLVTSQMKAGTPVDGWWLRVCSGSLTFETTAGTIDGDTVIADGRWHHLLATYDATSMRLWIDGKLEGNVAIVSAPGDGGGPITLLQRPPQGAPGGQNYLGAAVIDDLVLHKVAPTELYLRDRVGPRLPHVRFFVGTEAENAGEFPLGPWELRAGNDAVKRPIYACDALLSACNGWVAWWRFDDPLQPTIVQDRTTGGHDLIVAGTPTWVLGIDGGYALQLATDADYLKRDNDAAFGLTQWGIDMAALPTVAALEQVLMERIGVGGTPPPLNYAMRILGDGNVIHVFGAPPSSFNEAHTPTGVVQGLWNVLAGSFDGSKLTATLAGETGDVDATNPSTDTAGGILWIGRTGRIEDTDAFGGALDSIRVMNRNVSFEEQLKYPLLSWTLQ